ncbi:glycosyltransferase family 4 protein [Haloarcula brevis]|uniref:glycosyltransferase family 4 protein n=1 Tax=Haloarcula brevis TaxID=3111453 RepID=UPI00300F64C5
MNGSDDRPRVGMILRGFFPRDIRVEKEARSLAAAGYDVHLLCLGRPNEREQELVGPLTVHRIHREAQYNAVYRTIKTARYLLTLQDVIWEREISRFVDAAGVDILHVHDLPLVRTAQTVAADRRLPVVADLHENYPEAARQWRKGMASPRRIIQNTFTPITRLKRLEQEAVRHVDRVLATTPEGRRHYVEDCGADPLIVHIVSNTVDLETFDDTATPVPGFEEEFVVSYVGSFGPHRGLETAIDAMPALIESVPNAHLLLVGSAGEDAYDRALRDRVARRGLEDQVTFTGWVDFEDVPRYVAASDVATVLHRDNPHTGTTVPHKLFQYMALRTPVVVSDVDPLARVVDRADAGRIVLDGDTSSLASALASLATDEEMRHELGVNGRAAVRRRYNWRREAERLVAAYQGLTDERSKSVEGRV